MIVVVGESLVDIVRTPAGTRETAGGSPLNVACGLARLDAPVLLITEVGHDDRGRRIVESVEELGVELLAAPTPTGRTSTARVRFDDGEPTYDLDVTWSLPHQELPACDALHVGSLGTVLEPGRTSVLDLVDQAWGRDVFVSYDPNVRESMLTDPDQAWRDVESLAERAHLVKLSSQDVALLHPGADPDDIARSLLSGERTELVLLTRGAAGASAFTSAEVVTVGAPALPTTGEGDTVGAGDAFTAAVLAALLEADAFGGYGRGLPTQPDQLERLLRAAVEVATLTCSRPGAAGPSRPELRPDWPG